MHDHEDADVLNKLKSIMQNAVNVLTHFMSTSVAFCTDFYTVFFMLHTLVSILVFTAHEAFSIVYHLVYPSHFVLVSSSVSFFLSFFLYFFFTCTSSTTILSKPLVLIILS